MNAQTSSGQKGRGIRTLLSQLTLAVALAFAVTAVGAPAQAAPAGNATAPSSSTVKSTGTVPTAHAGVQTTTDRVVKPDAAFSYTIYYTPPSLVEAYYTVTSGFVSFGVFCSGYGWVQLGYVGVGSWYSWVNCGSYTPTAWRFLTVG